LDARKEGKRKKEQALAIVQLQKKCAKKVPSEIRGHNPGGYIRARSAHGMSANLKKGLSQRGSTSSGKRRRLALFGVGMNVGSRMVCAIRPDCSYPKEDCTRSKNFSPG